MDDGFYRFAVVLCRIVCAALFRYRGYGAGRVPPSGGVLVVSNHQSYLDPVLIGIGMRRPVWFLARRTLFVGPFGWLIRKIHAFPVERGQADVRAMRAAIEVVKGGRALLVFPEGTRTRDGRLGTIRPGAALIARRAGVPIVPVYIEGAYRVWPRHTVAPMPGPVRIWFGEPLSPAAGGDERAATRRIAERLAALEAEAAAFRRRTGLR